MRSLLRQPGVAVLCLDGIVVFGPCYFFLGLVLGLGLGLAWAFFLRQPWAAFDAFALATPMAKSARRFHGVAGLARNLHADRALGSFGIERCRFRA